jgi:hypothetical protein
MRFTRGKNDKFLTAVSNLESGEPLWFGRERKKETLDEFSGCQPRAAQAHRSGLCGHMRAVLEEHCICLPLSTPGRAKSITARVSANARSSSSCYWRGWTRNSILPGTSFHVVLDNLKMHKGKLVRAWWRSIPFSSSITLRCIALA